VILADRAEQHGETIEFIKRGKPIQIGFIERFNRNYREAVLDMFVFQEWSEDRESRPRIELLRQSPRCPAAIRVLYQSLPTPG
jgi:transposase InsO family protein